MFLLERRGGRAVGSISPCCMGSYGTPDTSLPAPSEIKLSVTAAVADCIVDAVLGDLMAAQCKLVSVHVSPQGRCGTGGSEQAPPEHDEH